MKLSEVIVLLTAILAATGDVNVFIGDMKPMNESHVDLANPAENHPDSIKLYGEKYLHLGEW